MNQMGDDALVGEEMLTELGFGFNFKGLFHDGFWVMDWGAEALRRRNPGGPVKTNKALGGALRWG